MPEQTAETKNSFLATYKLPIILGVVVIILGIIALVVVLGTSGNEDNNSQLAANTCPDELTTVGGKQYAVVNGKQYPMSVTEYSWIQENCALSGRNSTANSNDQNPESANSDAPVLQNLGIEFGDYDEMTGRAGAFVFDKQALSSNSPVNKILLEFGSYHENKYFPEIVYSQVDADTNITAVTDGKVVEVQYQAESNDYAVSTVQGNWAVNYDHVTQVNFELNDEVKAGDIIGKVALNRDGITGFTEIAIKFVDSNNKSTGYCPLDYLAADKKQEYADAITELMNDWETYYGDSSIYNQSQQYLPGCVVEKLSLD